MGDFNVVGSQKEKLGGQPFACSSKSDLSSFINDCGLVDLGFNGNPFSWNSGHHGGANIKERLDRGLANHSWRVLFPNASISHYPAAALDHLPMILNSNGYGTLLVDLLNLKKCGLETRAISTLRLLHGTCRFEVLLLGFW